VKTLKLIRRVIKQQVRRQRARHKNAVRQAQINQRKAAVAQRAIARQAPKKTAGDLIDSGEWMVPEGGQIDPSMIMEAQWSHDNGWEYVPARTRSRSRTPVDPSVGAEPCRGKTKDGSPCQRIGNCPIPSHKRNKV
jgi:hypothetical protein